MNPFPITTPQRPFQDRVGYPARNGRYVFRTENLVFKFIEVVPPILSLKGRLTVGEVRPDDMSRAERF
jgi:hypothetical protein